VGAGLDGGAGSVDGSVDGAGAVDEGLADAETHAACRVPFSPFYKIN